MKYEIKETLTLTHTDLGLDSGLSRRGGCDDPFDDPQYGLDGFEVQFQIEVEKDNEKENFTIIFQPMERINSMQWYGGYEMWLASGFNNEDEELLEFCDYDNSIIKELEVIAEDLAIEELEKLLEEKE